MIVAQIGGELGIAEFGEPLRNKSARWQQKSMAQMMETGACVRCAGDECKWTRMSRIGGSWVWANFANFGLFALEKTC